MSLNILKIHNLAPYTSWLIGGPAEHFVLPQDYEELTQAVAYAKENKLAITVLGGGSNVLVSDLGVKGMVICLQKFSGISYLLSDNRIQIEALAGTGKNELLKIFLKHQLTPALFLAGLPGDVGGGVVMNAGVAEAFHPREFMELVDQIEVMTLDGELKIFKNSDLHVEYRHTTGFQPHIVTKIFMSWPYEQHPEIITQVRDANKVRLSKQPLDKPSCGSVFKNPPGHKVAQLIDQCGLKGTRVGDAEVSTKHANFIVNTGHASATHTWELIQLVKNTVKEKTNIEIQTEVLRLGNW